MSIAVNMVSQHRVNFAQHKNILYQGFRADLFCNPRESESVIPELLCNVLQVYEPRKGLSTKAESPLKLLLVR